MGNLEVRVLGGAFFPLLPWLRGAWAQAEKQGCYVAMETRAPLSLTAGITVIGGGGWEEDVSLAAPRVGARRLVTSPPPPVSPFFPPDKAQQPAGVGDGAGGAGMNWEGRHRQWGRGRESEFPQRSFGRSLLLDIPCIKGAHRPQALTPHKADLFHCHSVSHTVRTTLEPSTPSLIQGTCAYELPTSTASHSRAVVP